MKTIAEFFDDIRLGYISDAPANRFTNKLMRPYFEDALMTLYANKPGAFYGKWTEANLGAMQDMTQEQFEALELRAMISPQFVADLRARVLINATASTQRGQARGAPLPREQLAENSPR